MDKKTDRKLRLERLVERQIDPKDLSQVSGGKTIQSRYCVPTRA
jgi:hypothetical protein